VKEDTYHLKSHHHHFHLLLSHKFSIHSSSCDSVL
jgi:hypothetical protein